MTKIVPTSGFRKAFKRKVRGNKNLEVRFKDRVAIFQMDPFRSQTEDTPPIGTIAGIMEF